MIPEILKNRMDKIDIEPGPDGCWIWRGSTNNSGYPKVNIYGRGTLGLHRLVCEEVNGPPVGRMDASHICERSLCVRKEHLIWEPHRSNMERVFAKRRREPVPEERPELPPLPIEVYDYATIIALFSQGDV